MIHANKGRFRSIKYFVISRVSGSMLECADKFYHASGIKKILYCIIEVLKNLSIIFKMFLNKYVYIYHIEMPVTTKCSLRCKDCSNLMQYYKAPRDVESELLILSIDKLMEVTDKISTYTLLGGEPLLYSDLGMILDRLISEKKIEKIRIITNGTIMPKDKYLISLLKNEKVYVYISNYGLLSRKKEDLTALLKKENIRYFIFDEEVQWRDLGNVENRKRKNDDLHTQFVKCNSDCISFFRGGVHYCPRSAHGIDLDIVEKREKDYVDILKEDNIAKKKKALIDFINRKVPYIAACNYCNKATDNFPRIPAAIQMGHK